MAMISSRCLVLFVCVLLMSVASAQQTAPPAATGAIDERAARVVERYKAMLLANPVEGLALDRLWKSYDDRGATGALIDEYRRLAEAPGAGAAPVLIHGHLLQRAGRLDEAGGEYDRAAALDPASPLAPLAQGELAAMRSQPEEAAGHFAHALEKTARRRSPSAGNLAETRRRVDVGGTTPQGGGDLGTKRGARSRESRFASATRRD